MTAIFGSGRGWPTAVLRKWIFESVRSFCSPFRVSFRNMRLLSRVICDPLQQSELGHAIDQFDGGVMPNQQEIRQIADGNRLGAGKALDGEQRLVLLRRQAGLMGGRFAE